MSFDATTAVGLRARAAVVSRIAHESSVHAPSRLPTGPWWKYLESNFHRRPEGFELDLRDQCRVSATAAIDVAVRTVAATMVGATAVPMGFHPLKLRALFKREAAFYTDLADTADPAAFFEPPPRPIRVSEHRATTAVFRPDDGQCVDLTFDSPFEPRNPRLRKRYLRNKRNRRAHARYWRHRDGPRPTLVCVHGFFADAFWLNTWFLALPWLYRLGCDVLLFTLPFHGPRQAPLSPFSGHGFFAGGLPRLNEAFAHAVHDLRAYIDYLQDQHQSPRIGITGVSLGGYTSALMAAIEPRLHLAIPNVPVTSLADLVLEWSPMGPVFRTLLRATGQSIKDARHLLAVASPLTYPPKLPRERLMIIAGIGDRLAPPKHSRLLWDHWGRCRMHWFPGSHLLHLDKGDYLDQMADFLHETEFLDGPS